MRRFSADWKLAGGFSALLFLIVAIGLVGISRIESLGKTVDDLGGRYFPMQQAALEMRVSNSLYAMSIRNYVFWRSARYLEAARSEIQRELTKYADYTEKGVRQYRESLIGLGAARWSDTSGNAYFRAITREDIGRIAVMRDLSEEEQKRMRSLHGATVPPHAMFLDVEREGKPYPARVTLGLSAIAMRLGAINTRITTQILEEALDALRSRPQI